MGGYAVEAALDRNYPIEYFRGRAVDGTTVFLTRLDPQTAEWEAPDMFLDSIEPLTRLRHPNLVHLLRVNRSIRETFLVHEYVDGLAANRTAPLDRDLVAWIIAEACAGLSALHALGLAHRSLTPEKLLLARTGAIKVTDTRWAQLLASRRLGSGVLRRHQYAYFAPEQCLGKPVDRRADIWALGVILYELVTFKPLFHRDSEFGTLEAIAKQPLPPLDPTMAPALEAIVHTALERDPNDRYESALEMRDALLALIGDEDRSADVAAAIARFG
ncbi:MAG: serine/threonine-protein kinase [Kofleriaceae bacterium]